MTGTAGFSGATALSRASAQKPNASSRPLLKAMVAMLMAGSSASAVQAANCGAAALGGGSAGPPSISATEASTSQVLEEIRRRTQVAQQQMQPTPVSETTAAPAATGGGSAASGGSAKPTGQTAGTYKPTYKKVAMAAPGETSEYSYEGGTSKVTSSWGQAYLDYEFHDNIAPGTQENRSRTSKTAGALSGTDWTWINGGAVPHALQFGLFSGYQGQFNTFSDTNFSAPQTSNGDPDTFSRTQNKQDITGSFYGAYLAAIHGNATFDLAFKADVFDLSQSSTLTQTNAATGCSGQPFIASEFGDASVNNYTISGDASYRHHLSPSSWIEPTVGLRYTWTNYGNDATQLTPVSASGILQQTVSGSGRLGLEDGTVFRVTAGARLGHEEILPGGTLWTIWGGAYAYSDVAISGFKFTPPTIVDGAFNTVSAGTTVFPVDEGKVRGLGQVVSTWDYSDHWSYLLAGEIRGGSDLFGVGGRVGARYRW